MGSATPNGLFHQGKRPQRPSHKGLEKSGLDSKLPQVADAVIMALFSMAETQAEKENYMASPNNNPTPGLLVAEDSQLQAELKKIGKREFLEDVKSAAREALSDLPDDREIQKLDPVSRQYVERVSILIAASLRLTETDDAAIAQFAQDVSWAKLVTDIAKDNAPDKPSATVCKDEYQQCVEDHDCDTSGWVCVCCIPCSLRYIKCMMVRVVSEGGIGGLAGIKPVIT
jgi:hypothetical protein